MHEREFMNKWVRERLKLRKADYWLRLSDSAEGTKPFDGILITKRDDKVLPIAIEFKVWRAVGDFDFSTVETHQMRELLAWQKAGGLSWVLVLYERTKTVQVYYPKSSILKKMLKRKK